MKNANVKRQKHIINNNVYAVNCTISTLFIYTYLEQEAFENFIQNKKHFPQTY